MGDFPTHPSAVQPDWLNERLRAAGLLDGGAVTAVRWEPIGTGQVGDSARFHLSYDRDGAGPATLAGKFPAEDQMSRGTAAAFGLYSKEELGDRIMQYARYYDEVNGSAGAVGGYYLIYGTCWPGGEIGYLKESTLEEYIAYGLAIEALEKMEEYFLLKFKVREGELEEVVQLPTCQELIEKLKNCKDIGEQYFL